MAVEGVGSELFSPARKDEIQSTHPVPGARCEICRGSPHSRGVLARHAGRIALSRFPFGIPNTWYMVAYSDEIEAHAPMPLPYLGRDMVAFRDRRGDVTVLDGHCPHLGARLATGGTCEEGTIRCPFHGWRFDETGRCVEVPYAKRIPENARLRRHPVLERNGMVFVWHGVEGAEPFFEIQVIPEWKDPDWTDRWMKFEWTINTHPQEISENGVDIQHFESVHLMEPVKSFELRFDGPRYFWSTGVRKDLEMDSDYSDDFTMHGENHGIAYSLIRHRGRFNTIAITNFTAIDRETVCLKMGVLAERGDQDSETFEAELALYMNEHAKVAEQDFAIWEHKRYEPNPKLVDSEKLIAEHRVWARQFYADEASR
jgi:nitrite reductase/ring-hydroxylating ferredoxin subunit